MAMINQLREQLPFGEFRIWEMRFTGSEIRQSENTYEIQLTQERYIADMQQVPTKHFGNADTPLGTEFGTLLKAASGQLAWAANNTRPTHSFLASYLQGAQADARVLRLQMFNKAVRDI